MSGRETIEGEGSAPASSAFLVKGFDVAADLFPEVGTLPCYHYCYYYYLLLGFARRQKQNQAEVEQMDLIDSTCPAENLSGVGGEINCKGQRSALPCPAPHGGKRGYSHQVGDVK